CARSDYYGSPMDYW
nr:immunoglobulin heavy chain junction region [Mus musculus]